MSTSKGKCSTPSCDRHAKCAGLCKPCYSGMHYWLRQGIARVMKRKHQLSVLADRLDSLKPSNVHHLRSRRAA